MELTGAFTDSGGFGTVNLDGAHIGGKFSCEAVQLRNDSSPALSATGLEVSQGMRLSGEFTGGDLFGAVNLEGAHIGGQLDGCGADMHNDSGPALSAERLQVGQDMDLTGGFTGNDLTDAVTGSGDRVAVDLTGVQVGGTFWFDPEKVEHAADPHRRLKVDGLTYAGVPGQVSAQDWLQLLKDGTPDYAGQPYQQLAAGCRALGHDRQARNVLMVQRDDQLARAAGLGEWLWGKITKVALGYGYQPWRALLFLAGVVTVSCALAVVLGSHGALAQTNKTATPGRPCSVVQQLSVGLDLNLPVGTSVARADCDLTTDSASATAAWLTAAGWVLRILAWAFAALFIAGFTHAVRKT